jgi:hypothetical protein
MDKVVNKITFIMTWGGDILKSEAKVVVHVDKLVQFLVRQAVANLCMQQGKSTLVTLAST